MFKQSRLRSIRFCEYLLMISIYNLLLTGILYSNERYTLTHLNTTEYAIRFVVAAQIMIQPWFNWILSMGQWNKTLYYNVLICFLGIAANLVVIVSILKNKDIDYSVQTFKFICFWCGIAVHQAVIEPLRIIVVFRLAYNQLN